MSLNEQLCPVSYSYIHYVATYSYVCTSEIRNYVPPQACGHIHHHFYHAVTIIMLHSKQLFHNHHRMMLAILCPHICV